MAPLTKRRRLFFWAVEDMNGEEEQAYTSINRPEASSVQHGFPHTVDSIDATITSTHASRFPDAGALVEQYKRDIAQRQAESVVVVVQADVTVSADVNASSTVASQTSTSALPESAPTIASSTAQSTSTLVAAGTSSAVAVSSTPVPASLPISESASLTITSTPITPGFVSSSTAKNITVAGDILTSNLTFTSSSLSTSIHASSILPAGYSNSSFSLNATAFSSSFASSSRYSSSATESAQTSSAADMTVVTITGADGQPSTITTRIGIPGYGTTTAPTSAEPTAGSGSGSSPTPPPPGTIAGGVVGGAAGLAVLLLVAMLFLRWYRQKSQRQRQALLPASFSDNDLLGPHSGPGMAESAGIRPLMSSMPALFRHQPSKSLAVQRGLSVDNERGFQRLSGRKLPSAFSPGLEYGQQPPIPMTEQYRDNGSSMFMYPPSAGPGPLPHNSDRALNASPAESSSLSRQDSDEQMTMLPGPQRRPTVHNPNPHLQVPGARSHTRHVSSSARTSGILQ